MDLRQRPTFGAASPTLKQNSSERQEAGAVWKRQAKSGQMDFLSLKIKLTKDRLRSLLEQAGETVDISFVAFPNPHKSEDVKRPDFRIFEDNTKD